MEQYQKLSFWMKFDNKKLSNYTWKEKSRSGFKESAKIEKN